MSTDWPSMEELRAAEKQPVYSSDGEKIGKIEEIFYDGETGRAEWIGIGTGLFGTKRVLVPVQGARLGADGYTVPYTKDQVKDSPDIDTDEISETSERALFDYYGFEWAQAPSPATYAEGTRHPEREDASVTRSEEELAVGTREVEAGRVRLRKWVETEPAEAQVTLRREDVRIEREPIDEPVSGAEIGEEELEVRLRREEPVVEKRAVAKERVHVDKEVESETETVGTEVRKERVEVDEEDRTRR